MQFNRLRRLTLLLGSLALLLSPAAAAQLVEEVPFVTTPDNVTLEMLRIANVGPHDHVIDLGSGDGRIVILAARRFGATGLGVEIVPDLVQQSLRSARAAGVAERVSFREQDLFQTDLTPATVITMYLLPQVNLQLRPSLLTLKPGTRIVSHDWDMGDWKPDQSTVVPVPDKQLGRDKFSRVHLWVVPALFDGLWCGTGLIHEFSLQLSQEHQQVQGKLARRDRVRVIEGRIEGATLHTQATRIGSLVLERSGDELRVTGGDGPLALAQGATFQRANGAGCDTGSRAQR
jgi:SAM-dependent methyltransferase